ncbi:DUF3558 family protein [Nocardioides zeae]|uniref:DUF3558 family protein n=1 Tax=Nocardioides imazamoxiresistens TaxID=3231893 RepID=A0ABU3PUB5_9ACTN|nr:DUF3558 family protein [Nocardioides zeae]MDT9592824.1 DUF3558 family protein [Nocardioides zeae]
MTDVRSRAAAAVGLALAAGVALTGCSDDGADDASGPRSTSTASSFPTVDGQEVPDPCEAIDVAELSDLVGVPDLQAESAGASVYRGCSYTDPATDIVVLSTTTYVSNADFEQVWQEAVGSITADTTDLAVAGADAARLITAADEETLALSAVAAAGGTVDIANLLVQAPYDTDQQVAALTRLLEAMVAQAT